MDFDYQPSLKGTLLRLDPLVEADRDALFAVASDREIWALHPAHDRWQEPVFRAFVDDALGDEGGLVVRELGSGRVVGFSRYSMRFNQPGEVEIGWSFLSRDLWGGRHNREMKRLMLAHAFRFVPQVVFRVGEDNLRSRRAMEKIGGRLTERTQEAMLAQGPVVHVLYAISRDEFAANAYWRD